MRRLSTLIEDTAEREAFLAEALKLAPYAEAGPPVPPPVKSAAFVSAPPAPQKPVPAPVPQLTPNLAAPGAPSAQRSALPGPPRPMQPATDMTATPLPGAAPADPAAKGKKSVMYRGRKIEVDE